MKQENLSFKRIRTNYFMILKLQETNANPNIWAMNKIEM